MRPQDAYHMISNLSMSFFNLFVAQEGARLIASLVGCLP